MNKASYKLIFALLISSVLFVIALQAFWIRNLYLQKEEEFKLIVYAALEQVNKKLEDIEHLKQVQEKIQSRIPSNPSISRNGAVNSKKEYAQVRNNNRAESAVKMIQLQQLQSNMKTITVSDSIVFIHSDSNEKNISRSFVSNKEIDSNLNKFMDKVIMEIKIIDMDERNEDTIHSIITRVLNNKGIFMPFEFALKKVFKEKSETLARSEHFIDSQTSFVSDLSANKVFSTHNFLFVQFPKMNSFMFSTMKKTLLLSLVFSIMIVGIFYYVIRLISNQKKLSEIKNDFVNNMTHELKTPIATISLALEAIENPHIKNNEEKFTVYKRILKEENHKLNNHVERVLQMALLDKGELPLIKESVDLSKVIQATLKNYQLQLKEQSAVVEFSVPTVKMIIAGDEQHLLTVFSNLLDNALKYSKQNCHICISLERRENALVFKIKDNGIGISKAHKEKIFEKFFRAQGGNLHDVKGFGIGLSYVKSIVAAHGGNIEVLSEVGKGTQFILTFRLDA